LISGGSQPGWWISDKELDRFGMVSSGRVIFQNSFLRDIRFHAGGD